MYTCIKSCNFLNGFTSEISWSIFIKRNLKPSSKGEWNLFWWPCMAWYVLQNLMFLCFYSMVSFLLNAYYPRTPDYTLCSGVHVCWSEHSDSSFVYGFMSLDYGFGTMTATTFTYLQSISVYLYELIKVYILYLIVCFPHFHSCCIIWIWFLYWYIHVQWLVVFILYSVIYI